MIFTLMIVVFVLGYLAIALEHPIKVDKAASALIIGALGWVLFYFGIDEIVAVDTISDKFHEFTQIFTIEHAGKEPSPIKFMSYELSHHLADIAEILFFLLGVIADRR